MQESGLTVPARRAAYLEGGLSAVWAALEGGAFLAGFAVALKANNIEQGLLAALPFLAGIAQIAAAYVIDVHGVRRRSIAVWGLLLSRICWLGIVPAALYLMPGQPDRMLIAFLMFVALGYLFQSFSSVAWLGWMSDLVPDGQRGVFFSTRNLLAGAVTIAGTAVGAVLIKIPGAVGWEGLSGYLFLFLIAGFSGIAGSLVLARIKYEPEPPPPVPPRVFLKSISKPLAETGFRKFLVFHVVWMASVYLAAPFFQFYFLVDGGLGVGYVALTNAVTVLTGLTSVQLWGVLCDRYGSKPILYVSFSMTAIVPLLYVFTNPANLYWSALAIQALSGVVWAGGTLASSNLLLKLAPRQRNSTYLSLFGALSGIVIAAAPVLSGYVIEAMRHVEMEFAGLRLHHFKFMFLASFVFRSLSLLLLVRVPEEGERRTSEVLRALSTWRTLWSVTGLELLRFHFVTPLWRRVSKKQPKKTPVVR
jgi:MFS family permease